ncbi:Methyl-accepting chemotaxis sensor/transducer protein [Pseudomonas chlororaphis subsp. aurantiaca]|jgi:methyl-accepting chemotaxis protein|uniref:Methyl-accepting chemotaxis protein n=1 Tax=Pseudomonas chlororaphis subsp. aurantiaca TaxID=86192 RepID=A0AAJ1E1G6_9PSED|nr:methyl-accepting chemotaxis protein [Pseudomonas chlororaphis]AIS14154.1 chemotaxis protein [Pseudomonas chlororaphis subsp. aurantiaca]AZD21055.1 Methyl-accepting chemotaxis sensor/transducer protein [Pseudomonas chlororaphis subsp. aurantiaca]AZD34510.1 Methyl-accepting chemotaxis sensor/transducer protein [Pseudomonas chlororaphis subsp. aurantiaca]AZD40845.1 Methyl-accepting chemotaxis sensor/transducer protein [Pseudomonas chlororaphis subsp. aurantiaca]AZD47175.1 Methyl-accepting chem
MSIRSLNIAPRAGLGFGLLALMVFGLGAFALLQMSNMRAQSDEVDNNWLPSVMSVGEMNQDLLRVRALTMRLLLNRNPQALAQNESKLNEIKRGMTVAQERYNALIVLPQERVLFDRYKAAEKRYLEHQNQVMALSQQGRVEDAVAVVNGEMSQLADELAGTLNELVALNRHNANLATELARAVFSNAKVWVVVMVVVAGLMTIVLALLLTRSIVLPLSQSLNVAEVVAGGDLTEDIRISGKDEPARLLQALKAMQHSLRETIRRISDSSSQLASASEELSCVTEDATRGLHQQSQEIEQAATAVNQMTAAVEEVASNAVATSEASRQSDLIAQHGREQVRQTVQSIESLADDVTANASQVEELAQKVYGISKVLDVIRSVAEQTNLLALNAAIEAARAGDAGRGFAVVADEVRALAHRTQQSTQEIEQMIGGIQLGTEQAVSSMQQSNSRARSTLELAKAAGAALEEIAGAITLINERNTVIASASEEQAAVAREVDRNLMNIRDLAMQTSAGANQTSAASQELSRLAVDLNTLVARFSV